MGFGDSLATFVKEGLMSDLLIAEAIDPKSHRFVKVPARITPVISKL